MSIFDRYIFKNLLLATFFIACALIVVIFLTQSLRFLELVVDSGASGISFWILTLLALPRFFEIILPIALMGGTLFVYNRMATDSELSVVRSLGHSPMELARPALTLSLICMVFLWAVTMWLAPASVAQMHKMRGIIKAQVSSFFIREGVFSKVGNGLMVYVRERTDNDELRGLIIHDSRPGDGAVPKNPSTIIARSGVFVADEEGFEILVYDGSRQEINPKTKILQRLNFERYTVDLPDSNPVRQRWQEPEERTLPELLRPNLNDSRDRDGLNDFMIELHRRVTSPFLAVNFTLVACVTLLLGPVSRRGYSSRIALAIGAIMVLESLFLGSANLARNSHAGLILMYLVSLGPIALALFFLSKPSEGLRRRLLYRSPKSEAV